MKRNNGPKANYCFTGEVKYIGFVNKITTEKYYVARLN